MANDPREDQSVNDDNTQRAATGVWGAGALKAGLYDPAKTNPTGDEEKSAGDADGD